LFARFVRLGVVDVETRSRFVFWSELKSHLSGQHKLKITINQSEEPQYIYKEAYLPQDLDGFQHSITLHACMLIASGEIIFPGICLSSLAW